MNDTSIHRLLDEVFAGVTMTPEAQDLKEEVRGNLVARVAELQDGGMDAAKAASTAVRELGDVRELVAAVDTGPARSPHIANRVRPKPGFVLRAVVLSLVLAAGAIFTALAAFGVVALPATTILLIGLLAFALPVGLVTADALRQETTVHHRLPRGRALGYGAAALALGAGLVFAAVWFVDRAQLWLLIGGILLALAAIIAFVWLGVTQTNRTKAWVLQQGGEDFDRQIEDRFSKDPAAAARFGIYTLVIWLLAITAFVILSMTVGFGWSWLALVGGFVVFMLVLARSLFGSSGDRAESRSKVDN